MKVEINPNIVLETLNKNGLNLTFKGKLTKQVKDIQLYAI